MGKVVGVTTFTDGDLEAIFNLLAENYLIAGSGVVEIKLY